MDAEQILYKDPMFVPLYFRFYFIFRLSKFLKEMCTWVWDEIVEPAREHQFTEAEFTLLKVICFITSGK
jgi:p-aminobenzoyl-glutamate transporter AbgT